MITLLVNAFLPLCVHVCVCACVRVCVRVRVCVDYSSASNALLNFIIMVKPRVSFMTGNTGPDLHKSPGEGWFQV